MTTEAKTGGRPTVAALLDHSHALIASHQDPSGAYPAAPGFSAYDGYAWFRDGSFVAEGMSRYGDVASADAWHRWCARQLVAERASVDLVVAQVAAGEPVSEAALLPTRFRLDGTRGADPWWDFQTDGLGTWLWSLTEHQRRQGREVPGVGEAVRIAVRYLCAVGDLPCFDWWEEFREHRHVASLGAVRAGLVAATRHLAHHCDDELIEMAGATIQRIETAVRAEGIAHGRLTKWLGDDGIDASLLACVHPFDLAGPDTAVGAATVTAVAEQLAVGYGVHRYPADTFYGGGQWPLLTALLGWNHARAGDLAEARRCLDWVVAQADGDGQLPEQVGHHLLFPERRAEWVERWGPVARPLLWSHGMLLVLADELGLLSGGRP